VTAGLLLPLAMAAALAGPGWDMDPVRVEGTPHLVRVWRLEGREPGPTLLVIGGIHGDEPGGYLSADALLDRLALARGTIIAVPRSNLQSIVAGRRSVEDDLNRAFGREEAHPVIGVLEDLMGEADALLNLHDGWGFYRERPVDSRHGPNRFGQSIVADASTWTTPDGRQIDLEGPARRVIERVNRHIPDEEHHFHFLNTHTAAPGSAFAELAGSATYFGLTRHQIPGYGVETSKNLSSAALRVRYQLLVIKAFLEEFGLEEDPVPLAEIPEPRLDFLLLRVGEEPLRALRPGEALEVPAGATVEVAGVEASVERGLVVDVAGRGALDDMGGTFTVDGPLEIRIHGDSRLLGTVAVRPAPRDPPATGSLPAAASRPSAGSGALRYAVEVNGERVRVEDGQVLEIWSGDSVRLLDPGGDYDPRHLTLDLVGFPGGTASSPWEDRGYLVQTATHILDHYALLGRGEYYRVRAREGDGERGGFYLRVRAARLVALILDTGSGRPARLREGERLRVGRGEVLTIREVETTVPANEGIVVNFKGFAGGRDGEDRGLPVRTDRDLIPKWALDADGRLYEILVLHHERPIGRVLVEVEEPGAVSEAASWK